MIRETHPVATAPKMAAKILAAIYPPLAKEMRDPRVPVGRSYGQYVRLTTQEYRSE